MVEPVVVGLWVMIGVGGGVGVYVIVDVDSSPPGNVKVIQVVVPGSPGACV